VSAFDGWTIRGLDRAFGKIALFVPPGGAGSTPSARLSIAADPMPADPLDFETALRDLVKAYRALDPGVEGVEERSAITTADQKKARVFRFTGLPPRPQAFAIVWDETILVRFVYVADNEAELARSYGVFERLVASYFFLSANIGTEPWLLPTSAQERDA
jgi:hypothetical protein